MKRKTQNRLLALLVAILASFVLLNVVAYNQAYAMMHFSAGGSLTSKPERLSWAAKLKVILVGVNVPRPVSDRSPSELDADCEDLSIDGGSGIILSAWYCDRGRGTPLVILFHGYSAEKTGLIREAREFIALGASVLLVDFRGSGGSSESYTTIGVREADDVAAVFRYAKANLAHSPVVLFGQSMGGVAILRAVKKSGIAPDAVILEAVFDTMLNTVRNRFAAMGIPAFPSAELLTFWGGKQWGFNGFAHNPVEYAQALCCPSLFMHGANDPRATIAEGRRVFEAATGPKEFKTFAAAGHEPYVARHPKEWKTAAAEIIRIAECRRLQNQNVLTLPDG
jgi:pimeloyl-ACP methyl ester carboxylesterase